MFCMGGQVALFHYSVREVGWSRFYVIAQSSVTQGLFIYPGRGIKKTGASQIAFSFFSLVMTYHTSTYILFSLAGTYHMFA